jgi:hypothetical protein
MERRRLGRLTLLARFLSGRAVYFGETEVGRLCAAGAARHFGVTEVGGLSVSV